jgi:cytochrome c553
MSWIRKFPRLAARFAGLLVLWAVGSGPAAAQDAHAVLDAALASPAATTALAGEGRKASFFCANCHGENGISKYSEVPNLAGQHPVYLLKQIEAFLSGKRKDEFMQGMMKVLSEREKAAIAVFYSQAATRPSIADANPQAVEGGKEFQRLCAGCHGSEAKGGEGFPRLAGQQEEYLRRNLTRYLTMSGERFYGPMTAVVTKLGHNGIDPVVAYLASLK